MPHVVTQSCCSDASCVYACPVNCIHPTPDEPGFLTSELLHIDPATCVDCGACVSACPVDAIKPHSKLTEDEIPFLSINADFYASESADAERSAAAPVAPRPVLAPVPPPLTVRDSGALRVAIVGSGPAAMYAADEVLTIPGATVDMFERLSVPYGLARFGVAPDHRRTRRVTERYDRIREDGRSEERFRLFLDVEVGTDLTHADLLDHHHAVIYAVGASTDRRLDVPGADLPGTASATEFVAWYNGHPDYVQNGRTFDLSHPRAMVIGNGNVALDVARILTADPATLDGTDIAPHALAALRASRVEEVVVVGRRGPAQSAFTLPEILGLRGTPGVDLIVDDTDLIVNEALEGATAGDRKAELLRGLPRSGQAPRRIVLRYLRSPLRVLGDRRVAGVEFERNELVADTDGTVRTKPTGERESLDAGLVLTSIGYRGVPVAGLPFDDASGVVPNDRGRVIDPQSGSAVPGSFVAGWIKRGPTGFIGTNKSCAEQTVSALVDDFNAGRLPTPGGGRRTTMAELAELGGPALAAR